MLSSCKSKWAYKRQYEKFRWKIGTTTRAKEERQMGSVVWKREVPQKVLEKCGMKPKTVKSKLRSAERGGVKECGTQMRSTERGGVMECGMKLRSAEGRWVTECKMEWRNTKTGGLRSAEWHGGELIQAAEHQWYWGVLIPEEERRKGVK